MPVKIAPTQAEPSHPFTLIDTPEGRLVDGSVARFTLNGKTTEVALQTHKPFKTAQGALPPGLSGGKYDVRVHRPDDTELAIGVFLVEAPAAAPTEPSIEPTAGFAGDAFSVTDEQGRMMQGDLA